MSSIDYNFKEEDWKFEISCGCEGYRNSKTGEWVYSIDFHQASHIKTINNAKRNLLMKTILLDLSKLNKDELELIEIEISDLKRKLK